MVNNPFILYGYESEKYFCDRKEETQELLKLLENGNHVALIAPVVSVRPGLLRICSISVKCKKIIIPS